MIIKDTTKPTAPRTWAVRYVDMWISHNLWSDHRGPEKDNYEVLMFDISYDYNCYLVFCCLSDTRLWELVRRQWFEKRKVHEIPRALVS